MQDSNKDTPKLERTRRTHKASTSDVRRTLSETLLSNIHTVPSKSETKFNRKEIVPNDVRTHKLQKKGIATSRQSIMPSQSLLDIQKSTDTESKHLELSLLYDEYLQSILGNLIIKKKIEEMKNCMVTQLATVTQEIDQDMKKLIKIKTREQDIKNLSLAQAETDIQVAALTKYTKNEMFNTVKDKLSKLQSHLEPLDILCCNDIILPETSLQWKETEEVLRMCSKILKDIIDLIGSEAEVYCTINAELKNFTETYSEIENIHKKLLEALCKLQIRMLKYASLLMQNETQ